MTGIERAVWAPAHILSWGILLPVMPSCIEAPQIITFLLQLWKLCLGGCQLHARPLGVDAAGQIGPQALNPDF